MSRVRRAVVVGPVALLVAVAGGCAAAGSAGRVAPAAVSGSPSPGTPGTPGTPTATPGEPGPTGAAAALADLAALRPQPRRAPVDYDRDAFGAAWADTDGNGCNQRDDVLARDAVPGTLTVGVQGRCDHDVLAGTWIDPYTGRRLVETDMKDLAQAQAVQIDHVVPLAEAWASGASGWSDERRERFANDWSELLAVDGPTNASKGDDDPAAWRPRRAFQCAYAERWIAAKTTYGLAADRPEKRALRELLGYC